jgi:hypothetical protein
VTWPLTCVLTQCICEPGIVLLGVIVLALCRITDTWHLRCGGNPKDFILSKHTGGIMERRVRIPLCCRPVKFSHYKENTFCAGQVPYHLNHTLALFCLVIFQISLVLFWPNQTESPFSFLYLLHSWNYRCIPPHQVCWDGVSLMVCPGWPWTANLPISASWVAAGITDVSHCAWPEFMYFKRPITNIVLY